MKLTKLEINGFKSFAKKTELLFNDGITGILGPNGCGKSNIADAFRFVLGEQSARALRGKKVEDFIFGGTEKRKPLSFCEVSMYFDNTDGTLASPYSEVAVTRRAFRSGESEYYINKNACRLKDIQELFRDTGIGKDGYSIIGQGRVGEILSDRSNERRIVFEEAAGVMKYRTRKEEAERKLVNTSKNLVRLEDILRELEERVEPLREQSEKAITYFKFREELRDIEVNLFLLQYDRSTERIKLITDTLVQLNDELNSALNDEESVQVRCAEEESAERILSASIGEVSQELIELSKTVESGVGGENLLKERIAAIERETEQFAAERESIDKQIADNREQIEILAKNISGFAVDTGDLESRLKAANDALNSIQSRIDEKEAENEAKKAAMMENMNRLADMRSRSSRLDAMRESLNQRIEEIKCERAEADEEAKKLREEIDGFNAEIDTMNAVRDAVLAKKAEADARSSALQAELVKAHSSLRQCEDDINAIRSRSKVLEDLKRSHDGYFSSVKRLLDDASKDPRLAERIHGVVAELISVPKDYETAVEMALGSALQNIVVPTEQDAKAVINHLREREYGRATLLPVSTMRPRLLSSEEKSYIKVDGCFGVASELIDCSPTYRGVIENLLGRTVIVRDIDTGILINKRAHSSFRIATLKGDILNPGGSMTGGSTQKREISLLGREREIEELAAKLKKTSEKAEMIKADAADIRERLDEVLTLTNDADEKLREVDLALASVREKADITAKYVLKNSESIEKLNDEVERINDSMADIAAKQSEASDAVASIDEGNTVTNEDIRAVQAELAVLRTKLQSANDEAAGIQVLLMAATKEKAAASSEIHRLESEIESYKKRIEQRTAEMSANRGSIRELEAQVAAVSETVEKDREREETLKNKLHTMERKRFEHQTLIDELRVKRDELSSSITDLRERKHKNEMLLSKLQIELENTTERIWQDYELTYENAQTYRKPGSYTQMNSRCGELRRSIKDLGEVNTGAIEDYKSVKERYDDLSTQCTDLRQAEQDLNELIAELTSTMETSFMEQFALIQKNFSDTFKELFGGGYAEIKLADASDVLNSNIDIVAQPPGKRLQLLSLLSGGEQALTAIALLFAILKLKPAAFCILDEIDTSLDEANVDCFANYLSDYATGTQFIIITHRKGAMAVCDSLYGVSMEEKGVSSLVSAKFD